MVNISSDNNFVQKNLESLCQTVLEHDGFIHSDIEIVDTAGQSSVFFRNADYKDFIFKIPHSLLIPYEHFDFDIENNNIVIAHINDAADPLHIQIIEKMLAIYNESGKFSHHIETTPVLQYSHYPELIKKLLSAREGPLLKVFHDVMKNKNTQDYVEELGLLSFFKSRLMQSRLHNPENVSTAVILPVIELMNHHNNGALFNTLYKRTPVCLATRSKQCVPDSEECFTYYGRFDSLDTLLHYGFFDDKSIFVRSIPINIELDALGTLSIGAANRFLKRDDIHEQYQDLSFYLPKTFFNNVLKTAKLDFALIPQNNAPLALRRVLEYAIKNLSPTLNDETLQMYVLESENQILEANTDYYQSLKKQCKKHKKSSFTSTISSLTDHQIHKILFYKKMHNL